MIQQKNSQIKLAHRRGFAYNKHNLHRTNSDESAVIFIKCNVKMKCVYAG